MKIAFLSSTKVNSGPSNVHRGLVAHWPKCDDLILVSQTSKLSKLIDSLAKGMHADVVFSGDADWPELIACRVLHAFGKPVVCFNHGYAPYENEVNRLGMTNRKMDFYRSYLADADAVIASSKRQMEFVATAQTELKCKLSYVNNAIDSFACVQHRIRRNGTIRVAVSGGTRPIKGNEIVAKSVKLLNEKGIRASLAVYGTDDAENSGLLSLLGLPYIDMKGQVPRSQFLKELQDVDVFVMNSMHESFGLSAIDAIEAGCSLLLTRNCGVADVFALSDCDLIEDRDDPIEIANKIQELNAQPNCERLYHTIDFKVFGWENAALKLRNIIRSVVESKANNANARGSL